MKLKIEKIELDKELQSRAGMNEEVVQEYMHIILGGVQMPPVTVFHDGKKYHLADGWHRFSGHKAAGFTEIEANIIEGTRRDAVLYSVGANDDHGLRRSNEDKRRSVTILLDDFEWSEWSDSDIARACKVSSVFVNKIRKLLKGDEVPAVRKVRRGDTEYEMDTSKIGDKEPAIEYEEDKLEEMATEFKAIADENEELRTKLAIKVMEGTEEEKQEAQAIIADLRETVKSLEAQVKGLTASRDAYQFKNAELLKQVNYWKKQAQK
jgi:ParB-like chromosome segregation protein Spo0J